jgi:hypothetical protein
MRIVVHYEVVTEESAAAGEAEGRGHERDVDVEDVGEALEFLRREGPLEPSAAPGYHPGTWYTGPVIQDRAFFEKGESRTLSYHLKDFSPEGEEAVWLGLMTKNALTVEQLVGRERIVRAAAALNEAAAKGFHARHPAVANHVDALRVRLVSGADGTEILEAAGNLVRSFEATEHSRARPGECEAVERLVDRAEELGFLLHVVPPPKVSEEIRARARRLVNEARNSGSAVDGETRIGVRLGAVAGKPRMVAFYAAPGGAEQPVAAFERPEDVEWLAQGVFAEAEAVRAELLSFAAEDPALAGCGGFADLHDHMDANMLGGLGTIDATTARWGIGIGVADQDEAWCGFANSVIEATEAWLREGGLRARPTAPGR